MSKALLGNLLIVVQFISLFAYVPQFRHLQRVKDSSSFSLMSWSIWAVTSMLFFLYAVAIHDRVLIIANGLGLLASLVAVMMMFKYRKTIT